MNRASSSHPSPPVGEKVPEGRLRGNRVGSGSQCTAKMTSRLSMNHRSVLVILLVLVLDSAVCLRGRGRARGQVGSWPQCRVASRRGFPRTGPGKVPVTFPQPGAYEKAV